MTVKPKMNFIYFGTNFAFFFGPLSKWAKQSRGIRSGIRSNGGGLTEWWREAEIRPPSARGVLGRRRWKTKKNKKEGGDEEEIKRTEQISPARLSGEFIRSEK